LNAGQASRGGSRNKALLVAVFLVSSLAFAVRGPSHVNLHSQSAGSPDKDTIVVRIYGDVGREGVYTLRRGEPLTDVFRRAGIRRTIRNLNEIVVESGDQLRIEDQPEGDCMAYVSSMPGSWKIALGIYIDVNKAAPPELVDLSGVGPVLSERIYVQRQRSGSFASMEDLKFVKGIGPGILKQISKEARVGSSTAPAQEDITP